MAEYMGYEGLGKSQRVGVRGAARLAEDHGYDYELLDNGKIKIVTPDGSRTFGANVKAGALGKFFGYAEGGLAKQMDLFDDGGLLDEGGTVDEESGNDVPVGSLKKEVRDDIPAQLSEGEFVMPADVVRYHGLDKMMALRDEAKMGLQRMEDMGQMGNADEAIIPDGVPFTIVDLEIADDEDEPVEMQVGGFVQPTFTPGGVQQSQFAQYQPQFTPYQMPDYTQPTMPAYTPPQQAAVPMAPTDVPQFGQFVTPTYVTYVNDAGNTIQIPVGPDGNPLIPVPAGFRPQEETAVVDSIKPETTQQQQAVAQPSGGDDSGPPAAPGPRLDQFGREEDPRIAQVTQSEQFAKLAKDVDPRGFLEKIKDDFLGAVGASTTSQEYQKALNELSVGIANYTADPEEQSKLIAEIRGNMAQPTSTELGMGLAPVVSGAEFDQQQQILKEQERMQQGQVPATAPESVSVETARVTEEAGTTAAQAAESRLEASKTDIEKRMDDLGLAGRQRKDFLNAIIKQEDTTIKFAPGPGFSLTGEKPVTVDFTPASSIAQAQAQTGAAQRLLDEQIDRERQSASSVLGAIRGEDEPSPADLAAAQAAAGAIRESFPTRGESMQARVDVKAKDYERRGYGKSAAQSAARNKVQADDEAMNQTGDYSGKTTAVTDKYGNPVRSASDGSVVTSSPEKQDDGPEPDSRWCCSQMVHRGLWTQQHEFARLTVWSSKQPDWWKSGYHVWGKVLAKTFLRKKGFWTDVMQSFYDYHIRKKPYTWRTAIAHAMVYPGVFICGNIWTKQPKGVTLASFKELNG